MKKVKKEYMMPDVLLTMVLNDDLELIRASKKKGFEMVTSDFGVYEMVTSLTEKEVREHAKTITVLLRAIKTSRLGMRPSLPDAKRIRHLRRLALSNIKR
jgi:hypothetical protein